MSRTIPVSRSLLAPEAVGSAIFRAYGLPATLECTLLSPGINDTYQVLAGKQRFIFRVYRAGWRTLPEVAWELDLLRHVHATGVSVSVPVPTQDGTWFITFDAPEGARLGALFTHAPGQVLEYTEEDAFRYGCAVADLHAAMDTFTTDLPRFRLDFDHLLEQPLRTIRPFAQRTGRWDFYAQLADRLRPQVEAVAPSLEWGVCHGDLHGHNAHQTAAKEITFFDFDCGGPGWRAYDLAVFRWAVGLHAKTQDPWEAFIRGYRTRRAIGGADLEAVPLFVALRNLWLLGLHAGRVAEEGTALVERGVAMTMQRLQEWGA